VRPAPAAARAARSSELGSTLHLPGEVARRLEPPDEAVVGVEPSRAAHHLHRQTRGLQVHLAQHVGDDVVGEAREQRLAVVGVEHPVLDGEGEEDLDVDLVIGRGDTRRVVDRVLVAPTAPAGVLDASPLRDREVRALAEHAGAQVVRVHPELVVGPVPDVLVALARRLDVGADPAGEQQVDRCTQHRLDELWG
jgi:hypothetical protein